MNQFYRNTIHRSDESATWRWGLGLCAAMVLMPTLGSVISGWISVLCLFGLLYIANNFQHLTITPAEKSSGMIFVAYVFVSIAFALVHDNPLEGLAITANNSGFIAILFLMPVVRKYAGDEPHWFETGIVGAGILLLFLAPWEFFTWPGNRVELLSSNPLVLGWMAGAIAIFNLVLVFTSTGKMKIAAGFALAGSVSAVVMAGGRGPILATGFVGLAILLLQMITMRLRNSILIIVIGILLASAGSQLIPPNRSLQQMQERFSVLFEHINGGEPGGRLSVSTRIRLEYYAHGWRTFLEKPLTGHGRQNAMANTVDDIKDKEVTAHNLTHLHNAYLTEAVASGILGALMLLAVTMTPIIAAWRKPKRYLEMAVAFSVFTNICFMTNIGFYHDVMVFFFCLVVVFLNRQLDVNG